MSTTMALANAALPYIHIGSLSLHIPGHPGIAIQPFGMIVAAGVLIGAEILRRYAERHGLDDANVRSLTFWLIASGFIGAHVFDVLVYQPAGVLEDDPWLIVKVWSGISSYGGFIGGALGYMIYTWWKRLDFAFVADVCIIGLLPAFSIGRIACSLVSDHPGSPTSFFLGFDYPAGFTHEDPMAMRLHNLGLYELLYLIPVNILILSLAFRKKQRMNAGFLAVLTGALYAPVRFFLEFLRLNSSDPRYAGFTFAQWCSIAVLVVASFIAFRIYKHGHLAPVAGVKPNATV